jgi:predicted dehydrogenase
MVKYRWGIIGLGRIAQKFAEALLETKEAKLLAVASRSSEKAEQFAIDYKADRYYGSYEDLIADPQVDVIYIATPHIYHAELSKKCLMGGKHVLCEKPFAMNAKEAKEVYDLAAEKNLFIAEALWTRFLPTYIKVKDLVEDESLGKIMSINSDFGFKAKYNPDSRLFKKSLGGGALLDVGIYPIFFAVNLLGEPETITTSAYIGPTGVDESCFMIFDYGGGVFAQLSCSLVSNNTQETNINGTSKRLLIHQPSHGLTSIGVFEERKQIGLLKPHLEGNGFNYQIEEVTRCLDAELTETPLWPASESLKLHRTIDRVRKDIGMVYSQDSN